jgi:RNA polymerase sigma-70 factor (ECF subfamily)
MRQRSADRLTQEDRRRFEEIFLPYLDAAYNLARWIIRHDQDAQDVVQDAYVRAFKGFQRFRGGGNSKAWFLTIVRNTAYTVLNRRATEKDLIPYQEERHANIISIDDPDNELRTEARKEYLQRALERLGIPVGTVMSRLSRARRRLQERSDFEGRRA